MCFVCVALDSSGVFFASAFSRRIRCKTKNPHTDLDAFQLALVQCHQSPVQHFYSLLPHSFCEFAFNLFFSSSESRKRPDPTALIFSLSFSIFDAARCTPGLGARSLIDGRRRSAYGLQLNRRRNAGTANVPNATIRSTAADARRISII